MPILRGLVLLTLLHLCIVSPMQAQEARTEFSVEFRVGSMKYDPKFGSNAKKLAELVRFFKRISSDSSLIIKEVAFYGATSPEGSYQINRRLARGRINVLEDEVRRRIALPDSIITRHDDYIPWEWLRKEVLASDMRHKNAIVSVIDDTVRLVKYRNHRLIDSRVPQLWQLDGGRVWQQLYARFFKKMRNACAVLITYQKVEPAMSVAVADTSLIAILPVDSLSKVSTDSIAVAPAVCEKKDSLVLPTEPTVNAAWQRRIWVKTNTLAWALAIANIEAEADLAPHWSLTIPFHYSAWNYFASNVKFRTMAFYPEVRYWCQPQNEGWFVGAHFGLAWYNFAIGGTYRTQDAGGTSPAIGGGLSGGYRLPLSANGKWHLELGAGLGAYRLRHDKFRNVPNGAWVSRENRTFLGLDRVSVTIAYSFPIKRRVK